MSRRIRVIIVNYNGGAMTVSCLDSLRRLDWPGDQLEVMVIDNASTDGSLERIHRAHPWARLIASPSNLGFAGGNNLGLRDLTGIDYVALLNNDTTVGPDWLTPLVQALENDPTAGAACSKILFSGQFSELAFSAATSRRGRGDSRDLGVEVSGVEVDGVDGWNTAQFVEGWWGIEYRPSGERYQWSCAEARLRLPDGRPARLRLAADGTTEVHLRSGGDNVTLTVDGRPGWYQVPNGGQPRDIMNNAGNQLAAGGYGVNRGMFEPDTGQFDEGVEVFGWCGASVLLRPAYLRDAGLFDERLFLYYEDLDLSWRGRARGWRYLYVPASVVRHIHAATTIEGSAVSAYYTERNRLVVLAGHGPARLAAGAVIGYLFSTGSYLRRDIVAPWLNGQAVRPTVAARRLRSFLGFLRLLPSTLAIRRGHTRIG